LLPSALALAAFFPFFFEMRLMEKRAAQDHH
jgi:hypothetical protein